MPDPQVNPQPLKDTWEYNLAAQHTLNEEGKRKIKALRSTAIAMSAAIIDLVPGGRDQALALTKLEELTFHANAGIARTFNEQVMGTPEEDKAKADEPKE